MNFLPSYLFSDQFFRLIINRGKLVARPVWQDHRKDFLQSAAYYYFWAISGDPSLPKLPCYWQRIARQYGYRQETGKWTAYPTTPSKPKNEPKKCDWCRHNQALYHVENQFICRSCYYTERRKIIRRRKQK